MKLDIDHELLMPLADFLACLAGVKPRSAMQKIKRIKNQLVDLFLHRMTEEDDMDISVCIEVEGVKVTNDDASNMRIESDFGKVRVTPIGAKKIVALYQAGVFTEKVPNPDAPLSEKVISYLRSHPELLEKTKQRRATRKTEKAYQDKLDDPSKIKECDFSYSLLNDVFIHLLGIGGHTKRLIIGGVKVTKHLYMQPSNSGKSRDYDVVFTWTGNDGKPKSISKDSHYSNNRRNDASRSWGMSA